MKHTRILAALIALLTLAGSAHAEVIKLPMDFSGGTVPQRKYEIGLPEYQDPSIHVTRRSDRPILPDGKETRLYALRVKIADPSQLRTQSMKGLAITTAGTPSASCCARAPCIRNPWPRARTCC